MSRTASIPAALAVLLIVSSLAEAQRPRRPGGFRRAADQLKQGDKAPDFELKKLDGKETVKLSSFFGKKPVALIFGSYT